MAIINKTGIGNGNTIQAEHITRIIDTLTNSTGSHVTVSGSFTGTATLTSATISGGTATLSSAVINGTLTNGTTPLATGASSHAEGRAATASGNYSHAEGEYSIASGQGSHAEGNTTIAAGAYSHTQGSSTYASGQGARAAGYLTSASGNWSHAEGAYTNAVQTSAHTEGYYTFAREYAHAEGYLTSASAYYSHAEGQGTQTNGQSSHAEGRNTIASASYSHAEGYGADAEGDYSHAEGYETRTYGQAAHAEGYQTTGSGTYSHAEGYQTTALLIAAHAEGYRTVASGSYSHAEGNGSIASGSYSHAEGNGTLASNTYAHSEGRLTVASGQYAHAEGNSTIASGSGAHAEGETTLASGIASHTEGYRTTASAAYAHAEGQVTLASGQGSHAEGGTTIASGSYSHAEGGLTWAINEGAHTEGYQTTGSGNYSHAEGFYTVTSGPGSHAEGIGTIASGSYQHASGKYNKHGDSTSLTIIGDGTSDAARSDVFKAKTGAVEISGSLSILSRGATSATDAVTITNSSGINLLTVQNDGNVGIGELVPPSRLYISASAPGISASSVVIQTLVVRHPAANADYLEISNTRPTNSTTASWFGAGYRLQSKIDTTWMGYMQFNGNNDAGISFGAGQNTTSGSLVPERMRIAQTGYVGIGTAAPSSSLHVKGNAGNLTLEGTDHVYMAFHPDGYDAALPHGNRKAFIGFANTSEDWLTVACEDANKGVALRAGGYVRQYVDKDGRISFGTSDTATPSHSIELQQQFGISPNARDYTDIVQNMYWDDPIGWRSRQGGPGSLIRTRGGSESGSAAASGSIEFAVVGGSPTMPIGSLLSVTTSLWLDANGNTGMGILNPWSPLSRPEAALHIIGSTSIGAVTNVGLKVEATNASTSVALLAGSLNGNTPFIAAENTGSLTFITSNTAAMYISGSGFVGIGTDTPTHQLTLYTDSAAKPSTNVWTVSSDLRLKDNIEEANYDTCYDIIKNLPLKRYTWKSDVYTAEQVADRSKLGWIAQDVQAVFPKAVTSSSFSGSGDFHLDNCLTMNADQIYAAMYGTIKKLIVENETLKSELQTIKTHLGL